MKSNAKQNTTTTLDEMIISAFSDYQASKNVSKFMETVSEFIFNFVRKRLNQDPEIISDFYVHFYEKVEDCLECYLKYPDIPFAGFFITSIRHEFFNFIRKKRIRQFDEFVVPTVFEIQGQADLHHHKMQHEADGDARHGVSREIANLPMKQRLPIKLYFGLELGMDELQELLVIYPESGSAAQFLKEYRFRRARRISKVNKLQDRVRKLNYQIHNSSRHHSSHSNQKRHTYKRWKDKIVKALESERGIYSVQELGQLFRVNKTTIARRIQHAKKILRGRLECQEISATA